MHAENIHQALHKHTSRQRILTGTLRDTDGSVLIFGIRVGLHLKRLLVINQILGTVRYTGARVVEPTTCLYEYTHIQTYTNL